MDARHSEANSIPPRSTQNRVSFLGMACEEPFRVFFPLGILVGIAGVSLWPLWFLKIHTFYPGMMHARLMIEGFLSAFVFGFLGTAGPRIAGAPSLSAPELGVLLCLYGVCVVLHVARCPVTGDALFLTTLIWFTLAMGRRFAVAKAPPPPSFVLVAMGILSGIAGTALLLVGAYGPAFATRLGGALLNQLFVLQLLLGVGGFLLPRFLNLPSPARSSGPRQLEQAWFKRAGFAAVIGLVMTGTIFYEVIGASPQAASVVRFTCAGCFFLIEIPFHRAGRPQGTLARCIQSAVVLLLLGLLFPVLWPSQRLAGLHVIFIGGFTLLTFTVATRVTLGHSGMAHLFTTRLPVLAGIAGLLAAALVLRAAGDFLPTLRGALLSDASYCWMVAAVAWGVRILPRVRIPDPQ